MELSFISLIPPLLAVILAFVTRQTIVLTAFAYIVGVLLMGHGLVGFPHLLTKSWYS